MGADLPLQPGWWSDLVDNWWWGLIQWSCRTFCPLGILFTVWLLVLALAFPTGRWNIFLFRVWKCWKTKGTEISSSFNQFLLQSFGNLRVLSLCSSSLLMVPWSSPWRVMSTCHNVVSMTLKVQISPSLILLSVQNLLQPRESSPELRFS